MPELAAQKLEPIVVIASKSKWYMGAVDKVKDWFGTESKIDADVLGNKVQQLDANTIMALVVLGMSWKLLGKKL